MTLIKQSTTSPLLSNEQAASILNLKPATLTQMRWRGDKQLPYIKLGKTVRYKLSDVEAFIERNTIGKSGNLVSTKTTRNTRSR